MSDIKSIIFYVCCLIGLVIVTMLYTNPGDLADYELKPVNETGNSGIGEGIDAFRPTRIEIEPTPSLTPLELSNKHLILEDTVFDKECLAQTWPQDCEVTSLPDSYRLIDGKVYHGDSMAETWPQACVLYGPDLASGVRSLCANQQAALKTKPE